MAALVQTYPQQTSVTMLQTRPTSTTGMMAPNQPQPSHQYIASQAPRSAYHGSGGQTGYRGSTGPVQPYAFTSTPNLNTNMQRQQYGAYWTNSSPVSPALQTYDPMMNYRGRLPNNHGMPHVGYNQSMGVGQSGSRDDSAIPPVRNIAPVPRPQSAYLSGPSPATFNSGSAAKAAPDRYRRPAAQPMPHARSYSSSLPAGMALGNANQLYNGPNDARSALPGRPNSFYGSVPGSSQDDMHLHQQPSKEDPRRMRRRSMHAIDSTDSIKLPSQDKAKADDGLRTDAASAGKVADKDLKAIRGHSRNGSSESVVSSRSSHSRPSSATNRNVSIPTGNPSLLAADEASIKHDQPKLVNIPPRGSSSDAAKRTLNPSPLSRPVTMANDAADNSSSPPRTLGVASSASGNLNTPAAKQLAALNQSGARAKSKTSRLRRAFSFGSAAELRKAAAGDGENAVEKAEPSKLHKDPTPEEAYDAEQARIAEAQEAAGIGSSIYGGRFFGGSTDNLSISSTASSASIMIRKMGRGMKKGSRNLVGLFRPKSVVGVPSAEPLAPEASEAAVSIVTVEAEAQRVNVTADPHAVNGDTGFPHLERNSIDAAHAPELIAERLGSSGTDNSGSRRSIVGGDKERAEVLAAVRKGILKRSSSPSVRPSDKPVELELPSIPAISDSPSSSAPSTPNDETPGHRRTGSVAIGNEDYFMAALRLRQDTNSAPTTPQGSSKRNATFSPRIIFYDTWPSQEYDRRGEIATCNRLTPLLAQQIKEELNTFKMEMEVHENSKIYTHFF